MECNKEEALRAKDIAERKMQEKDFVAARKFALKAQQLYPEAENISQMICVCDVHCAADRKIFGNELDWYGILQIAQNADDALIKKHYRKYALLLHPDKNKFAGAESAFKLIGDAQRALLDRDKRSLFDMRYRTPHRPVMPQQASRSVHVPRQYRAPNNSRSPFSNVKDFNPSYQAPKQQGHSGAANGKETFWTLCPFCSIRYQYYKDIVDRKINCQSCKNSFIAKELQEPSVSRGSNATHPVFPGGSKVGSETTDAKSGSDPRFQRGQNVEFTRSNKARRPRNWGDGVNKDGDMGSKSSRKGSTRRGKKQEVESSESFETDSSINTDEVDIDVDSSRAQRRSTRNKRHVSYNENGSDDDEAMSYSKKAKENGSSSPLVEDHIGAKGGSSDVDGVDSMFPSMNENIEVNDGFVFDSSAEATADPTVYECPDPEFSDFDREREEHCFKVGQMWAVYDTIDAMPRFYAQIRKVSSPGFKLRITWLEPDPDDDDGREWVCSKLPFSCGKFKNGSSENTEDRLMFSHQVVLFNSGGRETVMIYPIKGETWAVFKNWNPKWYLIPENERKLEYEFVEILSEFNEMDGIRVAILGKLKGFASLFCRKGGSELRILPSEILRFSHRVPSYRMTGRERNDVPPGSYELDPASLTMNLEEISLPKQYFDPCTTTDFSSNFDAAYSDALMAEKNPAPSHLNNAQGNQVKHDCDGDANHRDVLNSTYFDFGGMKLLDKFQVNQVWALYSDVDGLPRCYGFIKKIDLFPIFTLHLSVLEACYLPNDSTLWKDKKMPISCGQFKAKSSKRQLYTCTSSFSHQLRVDQKGQKVFSIYPQKGDVWALYKNWHPDMAYTELRQCEYDIVEVLEDDLLCFKVSILEHVDGFNSVFRPQKRGSVTVTWDIPHSEMLRFSHQIPSFRLHDEKYGNLRGSWELDRAALPLHLLRKSK